MCLSAVEHVVGRAASPTSPSPQWAAADVGALLGAA